MKARKLFSVNMKGLRTNRNLSQEQLADKCGLHRTYIGSVERGERNVSLDAIEKIAKSLNVEIEELFSKDLYQSFSD